MINRLPPLLTPNTQDAVGVETPTCRRTVAHTRSTAHVCCAVSPIGVTTGTEVTILKARSEKVGRGQRRSEKVREGQRRLEKVREGHRRSKKVREGHRRSKKVQEG